MNEKTKFILGTMTFGPQVKEDEAKQMVRLFLDAGYRELDTAYGYNNGVTEEILGRIMNEFSIADYSLAAKVNPIITGRLDAASINMQFSESLSRLSRDSVDILYLHYPDPGTPVENTLKACSELYGQGKFKEFGLSNFPAWMVVDVWHICNNNGWPLPKVYQGLYNGLSRKAESELFPALKKLGMRFYAYNPLAGGILTGKYKDYTENPSLGRFTIKPSYRDRYWKKSFFDAMNILASTCRNEEITLVEAAYRWLIYHSEMDNQNGDGIIVGASSLRQLEQNLNAPEKGPLPSSIIEAFDNAWEETRAESPEYYRLITK